MPVPLRLGVSTSCFVGAMREDLLTQAYVDPVIGVPKKISDELSDAMADFVGDIVGAVDGSEISAVECYHSVAYDAGKVVGAFSKAKNIEFWSVHAPYGRLIDPSAQNHEHRQAAIDAYCGAVDIACKLGAKVIVAHPGANTNHDISKHTKLMNVVETMKAVADYAAKCGIRVAVEPLPKEEAGNSLEEVIWILDYVGRDNVGINFDVNHLFPADSIPEKIRKAGDRILSVHISDQDDQERHWLPFMGKLDWHAVLAALVDIGYSGPLIYETHIKDSDNCPEIARRIMENYRELSKLIPSVR